MKFTEEQYQKIVNLQKQHFTKTIISEGRLINDGCFWEVILKTEPAMAKYIHDNDLDFEIAAIANPLTRDWAHDKYVEKEKKYYWKLNGLYLTKDSFDGSIIFDTYKTLFTKSEVEEWGYNPEKFEKEQVL